MSDELKDYLKMKIEFSKWLISVIAILLGFSLTVLGKEVTLNFYFLLVVGWICLCHCMYVSFGIVKMYSFMYEVKLFPNQERSEKQKKYIEKFKKDIGPISSSQAVSFFLGLISLLAFLLVNLIF
ncbi:hypothetical protein D3C81_1158090 [compost metagenome]